MIRSGLLACALLAVPGSSAATSDDPTVEAAQSAGFYPESADGAKVLDAALADARAAGKLAVIVFGADWCHDSRGLARVLTSDAFTAEFGNRLSVTFIDVGSPQTREGRNLDLTARFGIRRLRSTPAMVAVSPMGRRLNSTRDAQSWRNADSRTEAAIFAWFRRIAERD